VLSHDQIEGGALDAKAGYEGRFSRKRGKLRARRIHLTLVRIHPPRICVVAKAKHAYGATASACLVV